jgi:2-(1,2-epoxy-1,2-dihydrophenyl)acetyl-CoA isomerase
MRRLLCQTARVNALVLVESTPPVVRLTLNRPEHGNAVLFEMVEQLRSGLRVATADPNVRVAVITGAGRFFSVGGDLNADAFSPERTATPYAEDFAAQRDRSELTHELLTTRLVTIARVNGSCAGAGLAIALACDLRVAAQSAKFRTAYLDAGVSGDYGVGWLLRDRIGSARASELLLLSEKVDAQTAARLGLVTTVTADEELDAAVEDIVTSVTARPVGALSALRANLADLATASQPGLSAYLDAEAERQVRTARNNRGAR